VPEVNNDIGYVAKSSFYFAARALGLFDGDSGESTAVALYDAAIANCGKELTTDENKDKYARTVCFDALYCARVLSAIGFENQKITFARKLEGGKSFDFTRGALLTDRRAALLSCEPEECKPCVEKKFTEYLNPNGKLSRCRGLVRKLSSTRHEICSQNGPTYAGIGPAKDMCQITCETCPKQSCSERFSDRFSFHLRGRLFDKNCHWLQKKANNGKSSGNKTGKFWAKRFKLDKICRGAAQSICPVTCGTCDNFVLD